MDEIKGHVVDGIDMRSERLFLSCVLARPFRFVSVVGYSLMLEFCLDAMVRRYLVGD